MSSFPNWRVINALCKEIMLGKKSPIGKSPRRKQKVGKEL